MLKDNIAVVRKNIELACERAGRNPEEVTLIAVSKTKPLSDIEEVIATTDTRDFGENKVQEMVDKYEKVSTPVNWHLIGHLQTNKVKYIVDKACLIHSVDSFNLAKTIEKEAVKRNVTANILIEVNVAEEETKFGVRCEEVLPLIEQIKDLPHVKVKGLMTIAPFVENPEDNRVYFRTLRDLSLDIASKNIDNIDTHTRKILLNNCCECRILLRQVVIHLSYLLLKHHCRICHDRHDYHRNDREHRAYADHAHQHTDRVDYTLNSQHSDIAKCTPHIVNIILHTRHQLSGVVFVKKSSGKLLHMLEKSHPDPASYTHTCIVEGEFLDKLEYRPSTAYGKQS